MPGINQASVDIVLYIITVLTVIWILICNHRTHSQRVEIIMKTYTLFGWQESVAAFHEVSYTSHIWTLVFFRDPRKLYPQIIHDRMEWK